MEEGEISSFNQERHGFNGKNSETETRYL